MPAANPQHQDNPGGVERTDYQYKYVQEKVLSYKRNIKHFWKLFAHVLLAFNLLCFSVFLWAAILFYVKVH